MADAVTSQTLVDGSKNVVMRFTNLSDGTGESAVTKVDASTLSPSTTNLRIMKIIYDISGMQVKLLWDATSDVTAAILSTGQGVMDFTEFGGLKNNGGAGVTGNIQFTTVGHSANDSYDITLVMCKS